MPFIRPDAMATREPLPGWRGRFRQSENMSFAHYTIDAGSSIHPHHHPNEEVWLVIEGELEVTVGGEAQKVGPGCVAVVPADVLHEVRALSSGRAVVANHSSGTASSEIDEQRAVQRMERTRQIIALGGISKTGGTALFNYILERPKPPAHGSAFCPLRARTPTTTSSGSTRPSPHWLVARRI